MQGVQRSRGIGAQAMLSLSAGSTFGFGSPDGRTVGERGSVGPAMRFSGRAVNGHG